MRSSSRRPSVSVVGPTSAALLGVLAVRRRPQQQSAGSVSCAEPPTSACVHAALSYQPCGIKPRAPGRSRKHAGRSEIGALRPMLRSTARPAWAERSAPSFTTAAESHSERRRLAVDESVSRRRSSAGVHAGRSRAAMPRVSDSSCAAPLPKKRADLRRKRPSARHRRRAQRRPGPQCTNSGRAAQPS